MSPHFLVLLFLANRFHINNAFEKSFALNPNQLPLGSDIGLILSDNHVTTVNNAWHINPESQAGTDLELLLNSQWGFHPSVESHINITINGFTPNITSPDGEFFMLFAVENKFFSMFISLQDGVRQAWKSYPKYLSQPLATSGTNADDLYANLIVKNAPPRYYRVCNSNNIETDNWENIGLPNGQNIWYKDPLVWPLHTQITNDPINNKVYYKCYLPNRILSATYTTSFNTNKGMTIYIMNDASDNKPFDIYSIDVSYTYTTQPPTKTPTNAPTINTISPTQSPNTHKPTTSPTTPSPIIVIQPGTPTYKPTHDKGQHVSEGISTTTTTVPLHAPSESSGNLMMYLLIIIIVLIACFAIVCIGFFILWKKKKNSDKGQYTSPTDYDDDGRAMVCMSENNLNKRVQSISSAVIKKNPKKYSNISMTGDDFGNMDFNNELQNFGAGNGVVMDDIVADMATRGADHSNHELDDEFAKLNDNNIDEYAEGNNNGHSHQKTMSNSNVMEGNGHMTIGALSSDEKINSLNDERTQNICLNAVDTHGGDIVINDDNDEYETIH